MTDEDFKIRPVLDANAKIHYDATGNQIAFVQEFFSKDGVKAKVGAYEDRAAFRVNPPDDEPFDISWKQVSHMQGELNEPSHS